MPSLAARNIERARKIDCISWILELSHLFTLFVDCVSYTLSKLIVTLGLQWRWALSLSLNVGKIIIYVQSINQKKRGEKQINMSALIPKL